MDSWKSTDQIETFYAPSRDVTLELQAILEVDSGHHYSEQETQEIAVELISLYECLARERVPQKDIE